MVGQMIRPATLDDQPAIRELVFEVLRSYGFTPSLETTDLDLSDIGRHYLACGGHFAVLVEGDRMLGTVALSDLGGGVCELRRMYLAASHRGRGLGTRLLAHAIETAVRMGFRRVIVETSSVLVEAIALYQRAGFVPLACEALMEPCDRAFFLDLPCRGGSRDTDATIRPRGR
jgi:putative acetyltransferase